MWTYLYYSFRANPYTMYTAPSFTISNHQGNKCHSLNHYLSCYQHFQWIWDLRIILSLLSNWFQGLALYMAKDLNNKLNVLGQVRHLQEWIVSQAIPLLSHSSRESCAMIRGKWGWRIERFSQTWSSTRYGWTSNVFFAVLNRSVSSQ